MNLKHLANDELHTQTSKQANKVRIETAVLLHHLCEIQRRRAFAEHACSSLFEYCVKSLSMSEPEASRRVNAARAMAEFPEIEEKIVSGTLSMTNVSQAQSFFSKEARAKHSLTQEEKKEILSSLENQSTRAADKILLTHSSQPVKMTIERVRSVTEEWTEIKIAVDNETLANLEALKNIWSHQMPGASYSDLIKKMAAFCKQAVDPGLKAERALARKAKKAKENVECDLEATVKPAVNATVNETIKPAAKPAVKAAAASQIGSGQNSTLASVHILASEPTQQCDQNVGKKGEKLSRKRNGLQKQQLNVELTPTPTPTPMPMPMPMQVQAQAQAELIASIAQPVSIANTAAFGTRLDFIANANANANATINLNTPAKTDAGCNTSDTAITSPNTLANTNGGSKAIIHKKARYQFIETKGVESRFPSAHELSEVQSDANEHGLQSEPSVQTKREEFSANRGLQKRQINLMPKRTRYIHATVKHAVWMRDGGSCTFVDPRTGARCDSRYRLQIDHVEAFARGGENTLENLRLRCLAHNQWHAVQTYGPTVLQYAAY